MLTFTRGEMLANFQTECFCLQHSTQRELLDKGWEKYKVVYVYACRTLFRECHFYGAVRLATSGSRDVSFMVCLDDRVPSSL